jgi:hypothetical protein
MATIVTRQTVMEKNAFMNNRWLFLLLMFSALSMAQPDLKSSSFSQIVSQVKGDLNKDSIPDLIIVSQDTLDDHAPYRLQIFFGERGGGSKLIVSTDSAIEPQFRNGKGGYQEGTRFDAVTIKSGVVTISVELLRGNYEHTYRYQNGNFELIGFSKVFSDGNGTMSSIDFNLSTGDRMEKEVNYENDKVLSAVRKKIKLRPLPKLQEIVPLANDLY